MRPLMFLGLVVGTLVIIVGATVVDARWGAAEDATTSEIAGETGQESTDATADRTPQSRANTATASGDGAGTTVTPQSSAGEYSENQAPEPAHFAFPGRYADRSTSPVAPPLSDGALATSTPVPTTTDTPSPTPTATRHEQLDILRLYAVELINADRAKHGVPPVRLGTNNAAQVHAKDSLAHSYYGHWTLQGLKPYMLYRQEGGIGVVAENAAWSGYRDSARCRQYPALCARVDPRESIWKHQWAMMYDDAHADWGHRDAILSPNFDTVNIGLAWNAFQLAFYQHFEFTGLEYVIEPRFDGDTVRLTARPFDSLGVGAVSIFFDPPPEPMTPDEIAFLDSYCVGGGATDNCADVDPLAALLPPPRPGHKYLTLTASHVVADEWSESSDGTVVIQATLGPHVQKPGVYTVVIWSADRQTILSQYAIFVD